LGGEHPDTAFFRERQEELRQERGVAMLGTDEASRTVLDKLTDEYNAAVAAGEAPQVAAASQGDNVSGFMYDKYLANGKNALAQKNLREAESCLRSAMEKGQGLADSDPRKCEGIRLLAMTIDMSGKPQDAIVLYENALTIAFKFIGWSDVQVAHSLASLAELHNKINDVGTARNYYKQAVATYSLALGKDHETTVALQAAYDAFMERMKEERKWKGWSN
jgi:tetratricopeptide (TPR) repeat protein